MINDGALVGRGPNDYVHGLVGALPYEIRLESGDWSPYLTVGEKQWNYQADSMSCVSFSATTLVEIQEKFLTNVEVNYSDRWLAKESGTTIYGNYLYTVADTIRNLGLVLESDYPTPPEPWTFEQYHADITEPLLSQLKVKAGDWRAKWDLAYEWIELSATSLKKHLKHAPIQLVIPGHAIAGVALSIDGNIITYFDSYDPWIKTAPLSAFSDALKLVLTPKFMNQAKVVKSKKSPAIYVCYEMPDMDYLQKKSNIEGFPIPANVPDTDTL